jgi:hypothetical protein
VEKEKERHVTLCSDCLMKIFSWERKDLKFWLQQLSGPKARCLDFRAKIAKDSSLATNLEIRVSFPFYSIPYLA